MTATEEINELIHKRRCETWKTPTEITVPRPLFEAAFYECRESMRTADGRVSDMPMPNDYLLYGVKIVPESSRLFALTSAEIDDPDLLNGILHDAMMKQIEEHNEKVLLGKATGYLG